MLYKNLEIRKLPACLRWLCRGFYLNGRIYLGTGLSTEELGRVLEHEYRHYLRDKGLLKISRDLFFFTIPLMVIANPLMLVPALTAGFILAQIEELQIHREMNDPYARRLVKDSVVFIAYIMIMYLLCKVLLK